MLRVIKTIGKILCAIGCHRMKRGMAWQVGKRLDICTRSHCKHRRFVIDEEGFYKHQMKLRGEPECPECRNGGHRFI